MLSDLEVKHYNYDQLTSKLKSLVNNHSDLLSLYQLSEPSVQNRSLWVVKIATENQRPDLKPMVKYIANMHGNEAVGRSLMVAFIEHLVVSYKNGSDQDIKKLVSETDIHVLPSMNPDGFEVSNEGTVSKNL